MVLRWANITSNSQQHPTDSLFCCCCCCFRVAVGWRFQQINAKSRVQNISLHTLRIIRPEMYHCYRKYTSYKNAFGHLSGRETVLKEWKKTSRTAAANENKRQMNERLRLVVCMFFPSVCYTCWLVGWAKNNALKLRQVKSRHADTLHLTYSADYVKRHPSTITGPFSKKSPLTLTLSIWIARAWRSIAPLLLL